MNPYLSPFGKLSKFFVKADFNP